MLDDIAVGAGVLDVAAQDLRRILDGNAIVTDQLAEARENTAPPVQALNPLRGVGPLRDRHLREHVVHHVHREHIDVIGGALEYQRAVLFVRAGQVNIEQEQQIADFKEGLLLDLGVVVDEELVADLVELLGQLGNDVDELVVDLGRLLTRHTRPLLHLAAQLLQVPRQNAARQIERLARQVGAHVLVEDGPLEDGQRVADDVVVDYAVVLGKSGETLEGNDQREELTLVHLVLLVHFVHGPIERANNLNVDLFCFFLLFITIIRPMKKFI